MSHGSIALKLTAALIVVCLSGAASAIAQQSHVHQLRGAVLGMSLDVFKRLPDRDLLCSDDRPEAYAALALAQRPGFVLCGTIRPFARSLEDAAKSIADFELNLLYFFIHDATLPWHRPHLFAIKINQGQGRIQRKNEFDVGMGAVIEGHHFLYHFMERFPRDLWRWHSCKLRKFINHTFETTHFTHNEAC